MANERDDGGPAFPEVHDEFDHEFGEHGELRIVSSGGMSMRDYLAAKAMQSQVLALSTVQSFAKVATQEAADCEYSIEDYISARSYEWADAMLKARSA